jgi:hypothetical protein
MVSPDSGAVQKLPNLDKFAPRFFGSARLTQEPPAILRVHLSSDDASPPTPYQRCLVALERNPNADNSIRKSWESANWSGTGAMENSKLIYQGRFNNARQIS